MVLKGRYGWVLLMGCGGAVLASRSVDGETRKLGAVDEWLRPRSLVSSFGNDLGGAVGFGRILSKRCFCDSGVQADSFGLKKSAAAFMQEDLMGVKFPAVLHNISAFHSSGADALEFMGCAPKCFRNLCWLPYARAYSIAFYCKPQSDQMPDKLTRILDKNADKFFLLVFNGSAKSAHFAGGFRSVLTRAINNTPNELHADAKLEAVEGVNEFYNTVRTLQVEKGAVLGIALVANPSPGRTVVYYAPNERENLEVLREIPGDGLRHAFQALYIGDAADGSSAIIQPVAKKLINGDGTPCN